MNRAELFSGVLGHEPICRLLTASLDHPASAYLFIGPAHVGKRTLAERFMRGLLDLEADQLLASHPDFFSLDVLEGKTVVTVEQVRDFRERASMRPIQAPRSVLFFPRADRLNEQGMNALLKTIEEPPADAVFILLAEDESRIPKTVQSRSVMLHVERVSLDILVSSLVQQGKTQEEALKQAKSVRGLPGLLLSEIEMESFIEMDRLLLPVIQAPNMGARLAGIEIWAKWCESQEMPVFAWRASLARAAQQMVAQLQTGKTEGIPFVFGLLQAMRSVGSSVSPRIALEASVALEHLPNIVSHLPRSLPMVYQISPD